MDPRELLQELMRRHGDNPNSLARKLGGKPGQPRIHKFLAGTISEPRRSTMAPIADHYGIPLDALYDPSVAEITMRSLQESGGKAVARSAVTVREDQPASRWAIKLGQLFDLLAEGQDATVAFRAASQAVIDALRPRPKEPASASQPLSAAGKKQGA